MIRPSEKMGGFSLERFTNQIYMIMKNFIKRVLSDDLRDHHFTKYEKVLYGILLPVGFVLLLGICGWLEMLI